MILSFLRTLSKNNNREWFEANRTQYESAKLQFQALIDSIIPELKLLDPTLGDQDASKCLFRIYRDTRFSKNKEPYKTHFGAFIAKGGRKSIWSGYYIHLEPGGSFAGGGIYQPEPTMLKAIRDEIYFHPDEFRDILTEPDFKLRFGGLWDEGRLKRPPKGYDPGFEHIDLLLNKHYVVGHYFQDLQVEAATFKDEVLKTFRLMLPLNLFLNRAISMSIHE